MHFSQTSALFAAASLLIAAGCATTGNNTPNGTGDVATLDLIDTAAGAGDFTTLLAAVEAAGLTDTLRGDGPFTVFAPTDAAFAALPAGTVDALLNDVPTLTNILLYHVVASELPAADVVNQSLVGTVQGSDFKVSVEGGVFVNDAAVTATDIAALNGIIHVIDNVILPPQSIAAIAAANENLSTLVVALEAADLVGTLSGEGSFTVFAPTDAAFAALPEGTVASLLNDIPALTNILLYHVAGEKLPASAVVGSDSIETLQGSEADVVVDDAGVRIAGATISVTDIPAANGVIHLIDAVMIP